MEQYLDSYGDLPEVIGEFDIDVSDAEMCFVQYLPVRIPMQKSSLVIPQNLEVYGPLVRAATMTEYLKGNNWQYIYLTVKRLYGTGNRDGWHCDGFGTDDINYIWYDKHPTEFYPMYMKLPHNHAESMSNMERFIDDRCNMVQYECKTLLRMNQSSIHRVNPEVFTGLRTFVKISFSDSKYNLKGNAHNYSLDYQWDTVERKVERNDPIGG